MVLDSAANRLRLKIKLLESARPGKWRIQAFIRDRHENLSNIYRAPIQVNKKRKALLRLVWVGPALFLIILLIAVIIAISQKKKRQGSLIPKKPSPGMEKLILYIRDHIRDEITVDQARSALGLSHQQFYAFLKENDISSFPGLINAIRIERAKELLKDPKKNVSEVAFDIGYSGISYFTKVFKAQEGMTPMEFKKNQSIL
jgi:AraC-like DNA-binding protein